MEFNLISFEERKNKICYFCKTNLSVKYKVKTYKNIYPPTIFCCNMCMLKYIGHEIKQRGEYND